MQSSKNLPESINKLVMSYVWSRVAIGESSAETYCLKRLHHPTYYLKIRRKWPRRHLLEEKNVLQWLSNRLPVPEVVCFDDDDAYDHLLLSEISGTNAADLATTFDKADLTKLLAQGLRMFHETSIENCPFDRSLDIEIETARFNVEHNLVTEDDFDEIRHGESAKVLFQQLLFRKPENEDLVFTHGDYCLPNIIIVGRDIAGFVDLHRAGIADRYKDIALAIRSIRRNLDYDLESVFLNEYGITSPDVEKIEYYMLLDEFF